MRWRLGRSRGLGTWATMVGVGMGGGCGWGCGGGCGGD